MNNEPLERDDLESVLATRRELGPELEPALVDAFADKIMAEVSRQVESAELAARRNESGRGMQLALGIVSLVMAIPLTAIALGMGSPLMMVVCWVGVVLVNFAFAIRNRGS